MFFKVGDGWDFIPVFKEAKDSGLKLALHLCEVKIICYILHHQIFKFYSSYSLNHVLTVLTLISNML